MDVLRKNDRYEVKSRYDDRHVLRASGLRWDPKRKCWWTNDAAKVARLNAEMDDEVRAMIEGELEEHRASYEASRAADADIEIPVRKGLKYRPFQKAGIAYALTRPGTLIADEMGLGKTIEALGVVNALDEVKHVVVVCPAVVKLNWKAEAERWLVRSGFVVVVNAGDEWPAGARMVIVNYDILTRYIKGEGKGKARKVTGPAAPGCDLLIVDEAHRIKNPKAERAKAVRDLAKRSERTLLLTGTPIMNKPVELFNLVNLIDPKSWGSWWTYVHRFCDARHTRWGLDVSGASNLEELNTKLRASVMVRRTKDEVAKELPRKVRQVLAVDVKEEAGEGTAAILRDVSGEQDYEDVVRRLRVEDMAAFNELTRVRCETAKKKVPHVVRHVQDLLESVDKVVVFAHHHEVLDAIAWNLVADNGKEPGVLMIDGRVAMEERHKRVLAFQEDPGVRVIVCGTTAAGIGITLTAASTVVFAELDWVPANVTQAEDRCHRMGQRRTVVVHHIVARKSIDAAIANAIVRKQEVIDRAIEVGRTDALEEGLDTVAVDMQGVRKGTG